MIRILRVYFTHSHQHKIRFQDVKSFLLCKCFFCIHHQFSVLWHAQIRRKNLFSMFWAMIRFDRLSSLSERDAQYQRSKSLTSTLDKTKQSSYKRSSVELALLTLKLHRDCQCLMLRNIIYTIHWRFSQLQKCVLISQISFRKRIFDLLNFILVSMSICHELVVFDNAMKLICTQLSNHCLILT